MSFTSRPKLSCRVPDIMSHVHSLCGGEEALREVLAFVGRAHDGGTRDELFTLLCPLHMTTMGLTMVERTLHKPPSKSVFYHFFGVCAKNIFFSLYYSKIFDIGPC